MNSIKLLILVFIGVLYSCSNDIEPLPAQASVIPDFMVVGEDLESVYLFKHSASANDGELTNLSQEGNISTRYITLRQVGQILNFFTFSSGSFSVIQRNLATGAYSNLNNVYLISPDKSVIWGTNSESKIFMGYYSPRGGTTFGVRTIDNATGAESDLLLPDEIQNIYDPLVYEGLLFTSFLDTNDEYHTAVINTDTNVVLKTLDFGSSAPTLIIDDNGDLAVITGDNNNDYGYTLYDIETLEPVVSDRFSLNRFFSPGPLEGDLIDSKLYYANFYAQPSLVLFGPAVYDFKNGESSILDMQGIVQEVQQELQQNIVLTAMEYMEDSRTFLVGYLQESIGTDIEGGVLIIALDGRLLANQIVPFSPTYFVK